MAVKTPGFGGDVGDNVVGHTTIQQRGTEYGATYCWRLRPPPWVEAEAYRGSGADPRRDLVSAASAELARVDWCQVATLNPLPWALCLL
jgi:hypothetical protein